VAVAIPTPAFSRRSLLIGAAGLAVTAACSKKKVDINVDPSTGSQSLSLGVPSFVMLANTDQRVGLVLAGPDGAIAPTGPVQVAFAPNGSKGPGQFDAFVTPEVHTDAGSVPAYLTVVHRFPSPGVWWVQARYGGKAAIAALQIDDTTTSSVPAPGQPMVRLATPTTADHRGVEPICTRTPACPWHDVSLDAALDEHRPMAVLFATPRLCKSATCGPVLDTLLGLKSQFEAKIRFVHLEIYTDGSGTNPNPPNTAAVKAYNLPGEPFLFLAGADGKVVDRIDGLYGTSEVQGKLAKLAGT